MEKLNLRNDRDGKSERFEREKKRLKKILTPKEYNRMVEQHHFQIRSAAGQQVFDDLTGRTYTQKGANEPVGFRNMTEHFKLHRERAKRAKFNG